MSWFRFPFFTVFDRKNVNARLVSVSDLCFTKSDLPVVRSVGCILLFFQLVQAMFFVSTCSDKQS